MKQILNRQSGLTFIGLVFVLGIIALIVIFVLRLFPLYNEKYQVEAAMETVAAQPDADKKNVTEIRRAFRNALAVTSVRVFTDDNLRDLVNLDKPKRRGDPPMLHIHYTSIKPLFGDVQLLLNFEKSVPLANTIGETGE